MKKLILFIASLIPICLHAQNTQFKDDAGQRGGASGFYETVNPINFPNGAQSWWHLLDVRHSNLNNNYAMQFAGSFFDQYLWFRKTQDNASYPWSRVLTETDGLINSPLYVKTAAGQNFIVGHQAGNTYSFPSGIFKAITDNPNGSNNFYYEGASAGKTNFFVRADGLGYFDGGVGIGTYNLTSKLTVAGGDIKAYNFDNNSGVSIGAEGSERPRVGFHVSDNSRRFKLEVNDINSSNERLSIFSTIGGSTGSDIEMLSVNKGGNVGIGMISPQSKLHIKGLGSSINGGNNFQYNGDGLIIEASTGARNLTKGAQIEFVIPANTDGSNAWGQARIITVAGNLENGNATGKMIIGTRRAFDKLKTGSEWFYGDDIVIDQIGNVGIGTLYPKEKLSVYGQIRATEVKVQSTGWPDYVFKNDYSLLSLTNVANYIKENGHLPEIPSASIVEKEGISIGEMNAKLLKKVEELTLYLIEKDKQVNHLEEANKILEKRINKLEAKIK